LSQSSADHRLNCRGEYLLVRVKLTCGSTEAIGRVPKRHAEAAERGKFVEHQ